MILRTILVFILLALLAALGVGGYVLADHFYFKPKKAILAEEEAAKAPPPVCPSKQAWRELLTKLDPSNPAADLELIRQFLIDHPSSELRREALDLLTARGAHLIFSGIPAPWKETYRVVAGDSMNRVSSRQGVAADWIMKTNNLLDFNLQIGQELLIPKPDLRMIASRAEKRLFVLNGEELLLAYPLILNGVPDSLSETKVKEKIASSGGERFAFGTAGYVGADKVVALEGTPVSLRALPEPTEAGETPALPTGLLLAAPDLEEVFLLVKRGTPITVE